MYIGTIDGRRSDVSNNASNRMVFATGRPGSGKSARMQTIELECAREGRTVVALDTSFSHCPEFIFPRISGDFEQYVNRIDVASDRINLHLFRDGNAGASIAALGSYYRMGQRQLAVLRDAVSAVEDAAPGGDDLALLHCSLGMDGGQTLQEKMEPLLCCGLVQQNVSRIRRGKINIIDFSALDSDVREPLTELFLAYSWNQLQKERRNMGEVIMALDEIQNLSINRKGSSLYRMLREGRKFDVSLLVATQTLSGFSSEAIAILNQAATRLYFCPPANEAERNAREIDSDRADVWRRKLAGLKVGQCIAVGDFVVNGFEISRPLLLN